MKTCAEQERLLFERLWVSGNDIFAAQDYAKVLLKKGWHSSPWERRATVYRQQAAFTTALIVSYGRPFTTSKGWPHFPAKLLSVYDDEDRDLHGRLLRQRHEIYAHSDSAHFNIRPMFHENSDYESLIVRDPPLMLNAVQCKRFVEMTEKLLDAIKEKSAELRRSLKAAHFASNPKTCRVR